MSVNRIALLIGRSGRIVLSAGFGLVCVAGAQAFEATAEQREACTPDAFRLCSSAIPDVARVTACMKANEDRLSPPCRAVFDAARLEQAAPQQREARARKVPSHVAHYKQARSRYHHWARS